MKIENGFKSKGMLKVKGDIHLNLLDDEQVEIKVEELDDEGENNFLKIFMTPINNNPNKNKLILEIPIKTEKINCFQTQKILIKPFSIKREKIDKALEHVKHCNVCQERSSKTFQVGGDRELKLYIDSQMEVIQHV